MKATLKDFHPGSVADILSRTDWAILSAEKSDRTPEENAQRMQALRTYLFNEGFRYELVNGKYSGVNEASVLIYDVFGKTAWEIGKRFNQESVLLPCGLVYCKDGMVSPATGVTVYEVPPEDNYTEVPRTGAIFSVNLKFDN